MLSFSNHLCLDTQQHTDAPVAPTLPPSPTENPRGPYGQRKPKPSKGGSVNGTSTSRVIPRGNDN